jgi:peptidylprolyl isomerase
MANSGKNSNGSQFFITFVPCDWLDGAHVVFGKAIDGTKVIDELHRISTKSGRPKKIATIKNCGQL